MSETFLRKWIVWFCRDAGSDSFQNGCPTAVVGTRVPASTAAERRGK